MKEIFRKLAGKLNYFNNITLYKKISITFSAFFLLVLIVFSILTLSSSQSQLKALLINSSELTSRQVSKDFQKNINLMVDGLITLNHEINGIYSQKDSVTASDDNKSIVLENLYVNITSKENEHQLLHSIVVIGPDNNNYMFSNDKNLSLSPSANIRNIPSTKKSFYSWTGVINISRYFSIRRDEDSQIVSYITNAFGTYTGTSLSVLNLSVSQLSKYLESFKAEKNDQLLLDCLDGSYVKTNNFDDKLLTDSKFLKVLHEIYKTGGHADYKSYIITSSTIEANGWRVVLLNDKRQLYGNVESFITTSFILLVILFITVILLSFIIASKIVKPLEKLTSIMSNTDKDHFDIRFDVKYNDEVGVLASAFNKMMDKIQLLNDDIVKRETYKRITEIKLLQMQIKPHFLYNSMETCRFLVEMNSPKAKEMIQSISLFYKLSLNGVSDKTTIKDELEQIEYYLKIQKIRYSSVLEYTIFNEPQVADMEIPKFTLQPIVENAIYHGIKQKEGKGNITISILVDTNIIITITDDGIGMEENQLMQLRNKLRYNKPENSGGIGLINVNQRIKLRYGDQFGLSFKSEINKFTQVTILIPKIKYEDDVNV